MGTEKEKKWVRRCQHLLAKLGTACISEKGNSRMTLLNANVWTSSIPQETFFVNPYLA